MFEKIALSANGRTGNNTETGRLIGGYDLMAFQFAVEAIGATPTVTWKVQGSLDSTDGATGTWYDVGYITDISDSIAVAGIVQTTVSTKVTFLSNPVARRYLWFRLVTSANTNVTYHGEAWRIA